MVARVGFIGLGNIGQPMAARIVDGGFATTVHDRRPEACVALAARGARVAASPAVLATDAEVIGICVRDDADVEAVLHGPDGLLATAAPGTVLAIHSTITPRTVRVCGAAAAARGLTLLDAPITGGAAGAENGTLTYMVGGDAAALERCRPVFATAAARIVHTGALGTGAATKLCNNLMLYLELLAAREAAALARRVGVDVATLIEVSRSGHIMTDAMAGVIAFADRLAAAPDDPDLMARARHFTALADKDLGVALACAADEGLALPGTTTCRGLMASVYGLPDGTPR
ncbi:NAD(P)-dependent oxidoreductase [bacterium]|nr:NAD(P)-dependent oxidoreductase [bacterium]